MAYLSLNCVSMSVSLLLALTTFERDSPKPNGNETLILTKLRES